MSFKRSFLCTLVVCIFVLMSVSAALAAPTTVNLRVEGNTQTFFDGPVITDTRQFSDSSGDGPHTCAGPSPTTALYDVVTAGQLSWITKWGSWGDFEIKKINDDAAGDFEADSHYWSLWVNNSYASAGGCQMNLTAGDEAVFAYVDYSTNDSILSLEGPSAPVTGDNVQLQAHVYGFDGAELPAAGVTVKSGSESYVADGQGRVTIPITGAGSKTYKAYRDSSVRSNAVTVTCVQNLGVNSCGIVRQSAKADDKTAPRINLFRGKNGQHVLGLRTIKLLVDDQSDVKAKLNLSRIVNKKRCRAYDFKREAFAKRVTTSCNSSFTVDVKGGKLDYQLRKALPAGRYRLNIELVDSSNNSTTSASTFRVGGRGR